MVRVTFAAIISMFLAHSAIAEDFIPLKVGDVLDVEEGATLSRSKLRDVLKYYGYKNPGPGSLRGHTITMTAYRPDKVRVQITVHWKKHTVLRVIRIRNFWY